MASVSVGRRRFAGRAAWGTLQFRCADWRVTVRSEPTRIDISIERLDNDNQPSAKVHRVSIWRMKNKE
jgi:hypothetical protein